MRHRFSPVRRVIRRLLERDRGQGGGGGGGGALTWQSAGKLMMNINPQDDFNSTNRYRNLAKAPRAQSSTFYGDTTDVTLKTTGAGKGYPVAGTTFGSVYRTKLVPADAGVYHLRVAGNNPFVNKGNGSLSASTFAGGYTTATLTMTGPFDPGDIIAIGWNNITSGFQELEIMAPGYGVGDTALLTTAAQAHYGRFKVLRAMDLIDTNNKYATVDWAGSTFEGADDFDRYQNSIGAAIDICDAVGAECWINVPNRASNAFLLALMAYVDGRIATGSKIRIEFQNEPWNYNFPAHGNIMNQVLIDAEMAIGTNGGYAGLGTSRRILSVSRNGSGVVDIALNFAHGKVATNQVYDHSDASGAIAPGVVTLTGVGDGTHLIYTHGTHTVTTGDVGTGWFDGYVYLNPTNELVAPSTSITLGDDPRPNPRAIKTKWEMREGLRRIYDAAVSVGCQAKVSIVKGIQLDDGESRYNERHGLAFALDKYGSLAWLFANGGGLYPAIYLRPRNAVADAFTTAADVFAELEFIRTESKPWIVYWSNILATLGQLDLCAYEGGPHTDRDNGSSTVKTAIRNAHLDARMGTLIRNLYQDWADRASGGIAYYYGGSTSAFDSGLSTWPLIEGSIADDSAQPKNAAMDTIAATPFEATPTAGLNTGHIRIADVMSPWGWATPGNGIFAFGDTAAVPDFGVKVWAPAAGNYDIAIKAGSSVTGVDSIRLLVDGSQAGATALLPSYAGDSTVPATALTRTVSLTKGWHLLQAKFNAATRQGYSGLASFDFNPS